METAEAKSETVDFPVIRPLGLSGYLVTFDDRLQEPANRAALAFRAAVDAAGWPAVAETATSLTSAFVRFDPLRSPHSAMRAALAELLGSADWYQSALPAGRRRWRIPTVYGGELAPQLAEAAAAAGLSAADAAAALQAARVRVLTIGFAPGQPYLGQLPPQWDIPRQETLTPRVPEGALVVAIRQLVLFTAETPTGWRHVGQTAFRGFRPESDTPFALRPGDEVSFPAITPAELENIRRQDRTGDGGATCEPIP